MATGLVSDSHTNTEVSSSWCSEDLACPYGSGLARQEPCALGGSLGYRGSVIPETGLSHAVTKPSRLRARSPAGGALCCGHTSVLGEDRA